MTTSQAVSSHLESAVADGSCHRGRWLPTAPGVASSLRSMYFTLPRSPEAGQSNPPNTAPATPR